MIAVIALFIFGLAVGSFLNCLIFRLKTGESIVLKRSHCLSCGHFLGWRDLIPVFSFIFLKGKCRYCQKKISLQYPLVELASGLILLLLFWHFSFITCPFSRLLYTFYSFLVWSFLIVIFVFDFKHFLIPEAVLYGALLAVISWRTVEITNSYSLFDWTLFLSVFFSGLFPALFFAGLVLVSKETWMGWGDVFLVFLLGLFLGFPQTMVFLFLAFVLGALVGSSLILFGKKKMKSKLPFAPFLIAGAFVAFFWGNAIFSWYMRLIGVL